VRARLKNRADDLGLEFGQVLQYYAMERFLYRLSKTRWADALIVKGAALFRIWDGAIPRPTRDIDFLGRIDSSLDGVAAIVAECLAIESSDGIEFSSEVRVEAIAVEDRYPGVCVGIEAELSGARIRLRLDVGVADVAVPEPGWMDYPTLLGTESPRILAYQPVTAVAEKLEIMVSKGILNSRVKDHYDVWMLSEVMTFDGTELRDGIAATFLQRGTRIPAARPQALTGEYSERAETRAQWSGFVARLGTAGITAPSDFSLVVDSISAFIMPPTVAAEAARPFAMTWIPGQGWS
jgi:predicted nucleotidyltransferase component of viral defense system